MACYPGQPGLRPLPCKSSSGANLLYSFLKSLDMLIEGVSIREQGSQDKIMFAATVVWAVYAAKSSCFHLCPALYQSRLPAEMTTGL